MKKEKIDKEYMSMRDVARLADVSASTVSRVINKSGYVSAENFEKVMRIINQYSYVPNQTARNLFTNTSNYLAIFVVDMVNPFFAVITQHLNRLAFDKGYTLLIFDTGNNPEKEMEYFTRCQSIRVKNIILTLGVNPELPLNPKLRKSLVFFERSSGDNFFYSVRSDNKKGMRLAVDYLYNLNHRRIAFVGGPDMFNSMVERRDGFIDAMRERGLAVPPELVHHGQFLRAGGRDALNQFLALRELPTAVVCANDQIAQGLIMAAQSRGMRTPDDISVIGFDGLDYEYTYPSLTTIRQDTEMIAQLLFAAVERDDNDDTVYDHVVDVCLQVGESCRKLEHPPQKAAGA